MKLEKLKRNEIYNQTAYNNLILYILKCIYVYFENKSAIFPHSPVTRLWKMCYYHVHEFVRNKEGKPKQTEQYICFYFRVLGIGIYGWLP